MRVYPLFEYIDAPLNATLLVKFELMMLTPIPSMRIAPPELNPRLLLKVELIMPPMVPVQVIAPKRSAKLLETVQFSIVP